MEKDDESEPWKNVENDEKGMEIMINIVKW